ncbi:uncharacterized protein [Antedon mediterranea]|uniref:uncharacterized protein n=1 Tax=Antedon mediterranea TaxID=105859 RepID=UPI003AF57ECA
MFLQPLFGVILLSIITNVNGQAACGVTDGICQNGGTCMSSGNAFKCACPSAYTGNSCTQSVNVPCIQNSITCSGNGQCVNFGISYYCVCNAGYIGYNCEASTSASIIADGNDACGLSPGLCSNGGTCINSGNAYKCKCPDNFVGNCDIDDPDAPCASNPCLNGGTCMNVLTSFTCTCSSSFTGLLCETSVLDNCGLNPGICLNGGTCINSGNANKCKCPDNYIGTICETETSDNPCSSSPCQNGGTCRNIGAINNLIYACTCPMFYHGDNCQDFTQSDMCGLSVGLCSNSGTCVNSGNSYKCECLGTFVGTTCIDVSPTAPCSSNPCQNGGVCVNVMSDSTTESFRCDCVGTFTGVQCETSTLDYCGSNPFLCNGLGTCVNSGNYYKCLCNADVMGDDCESLTDNTPCSSSPCQNQGVCMNVGTTFFTCSCVNGYSGSFCEQSPGVTDYCGSNPGVCTTIGLGECVNSGTYCKCCDSSGLNCIACGVSALVSSPCSPSPCLAGGTCTVSNANFVCTCPTGTSGNRCQLRLRSGPLDCPVLGCPTGGSCINFGTYSECYCTNNIPCHEHLEPCSNNPCGFGQTCIYEGGSNYSCV